MRIRKSGPEVAAPKGETTTHRSGTNRPAGTTTNLPAPKFAQEAADTFTALQPDVKARKLSAGDAKLLSDASGQEGIIGEAEAVRAAKAAEALPTAERTQFNALITQAASPQEKAFIYKALGAGYSVAEVATFAQAIHGWPADKLIHTLNLADDTGADDGLQNGVKQQFETSCTATTTQAVRGELDPIYALQVRTQNANINAADDNDGTKANPALAAEQKHLLEDIGQGHATARNDASGIGTWAIPDQLASMSAHTGFTYDRVQIQPCDDPKQLGAAMDAIAAQVGKGIPTPLIVGEAPDPSGHCILAMAVEGQADARQFLIHDPWEGTTRWLSAHDILASQVNVAGWPSLGYYYAASPAPLGQPSTIPGVTDGTTPGARQGEVLS